MGYEVRGKGILPICALLALVVAAPVFAASTKDEVLSLKSEIEALKEGQAAMREDLAEIRKLLEEGARQAPSRAPAGFKPADLTVGESPTLGSAGAPVTMFGYSDYQCPFCSRHATTVLPELVEQYVDTGKLRIVMREFPIESIHPRAVAASQAALCSGAQGKYWEMHDLIFANIRALSEDDLRGHGESLGLDGEAFETCLANEGVTRQIRAELQEGQRLGISGTPSFVVGLTDPEDPDKVHVTEYVRGAQPFAAFQGTIDRLLESTVAVE